MSVHLVSFSPRVTSLCVVVAVAWQVSVRPFVRPEEAHRRGRVVAVALSRAAFFACICAAGGAAAAVSYVVSFLCFKQVCGGRREIEKYKAPLTFLSFTVYAF